MMGKSHLVTGVTAASWVAVPLVAVGVPPVLALLSIPVGAYAALLPDWDHHGSWITWSLPPVSNFVSWTLRGGPFHTPVLHWSWFLFIPLPAISWRGHRLFPWYVGHRGATHTEEAAVIFGLVLGLPLWLLPAPIGSYWWAFAIQVTVGCLTHLWGDCRTTGGLRARNGHGRRNIGNTFDTGSPYESWLRYAVYQPTAIVSAVGAFLTITYMGAA